MNLLLVTIDFPPMRGGVARYLDALARFFADTIEVVASPMKESEAADEAAAYKVTRVKLLESWGWPKWIPAVREMISRSAGADLMLVSHVLPIGTAAWMTRKATGQRYVVFLHGMDFALATRNRAKRAITACVLKNASLVVTNSEALKKEVETMFQPKNMLVVYPPTTKHLVTQEKATQHDGPVHLLTVGRLVARKGHLRVLKALKELKEGNVPFTYTIVGNGPMRDEIQEHIEVFGLEQHVSVRQDVDDKKLAEIYASSDIFVMPVLQNNRDREGFGMVYIEAAAYGIPSIATEMPGVDEAVLDSQTGLLVKDEDHAALVRAMRTLMTDASLREKLGAAAQIRVQEFTPERQFGRLKEAFLKLV